MSVRLYMAIIAALSLGLAGCTSLSAVVDIALGPAETGALDATAVEATSTPTATVVVLCDTSSSTTSERAAYLDTLGRALDVVAQPGTTIIVLTITRDSRSAGAVLAEEKIPGFTFAPEPDPQTDNPVLLAQFRTEQRERLASEYAAFLVATDTVGIRQRVLDAAAFAIAEGREPETDVLGGLQEAGELLTASGAEHRYLLILSDMVRDDSEADFGRLITAERAAAQLQVDLQAGRVADLSGVRVLVAGVNANGGSARYEALSTYWTGYLLQAGAVTQPDWYGLQVTQLSLEGWAAR